MIKFDGFPNAKEVLTTFLLATRRRGELEESKVCRSMILLINIKKIETTSNVKFSQILSSLSLNDVGIYSRDGTFLSDIGIVNLHATKGTHWIAYINESYIDSSGCICPKNLSKFNRKK